MTAPHLSKSRYLAALQCDRRLWLAAHAPEQATPLGDADRHILRMGTEVGRAAHALFAGGVLVEATAGDHAGAIRQTRSLMLDERVPAIFEAAFEHEGVRIRVDILERRGAAAEAGGGAGRANNRWGLREVKSSSKVKREQHLPDLAIQKWVLEGCGLELDSAELIHVSGDFVLGSEPIDWSAYFRRVEMIGELGGAEMDAVAVRVAAMHATLSAPVAPAREPGAFCKKPRSCAFWEACTANKSASWFVEQTGASAKRKARMIEVTASGETWLSKDLATRLAAAAPPVWALDFEAIAPAIPLFEGTQPYQAIAFQWSLHRLGEHGGKHAGQRGEVEHFEFLASGRADPRPEVARALIEVLGRDDAPVLAYGSYEKRCLTDMAACVPECAADLESITRRLVDLLPIVRAHVYHPEFLGSFSIKKVGPAFAPATGYEDLSGVADGMAALAAFAEIVAGRLSQADEDRLREELLLYCGRDTLALLEVYRALASAAP